MHCTCLWLQQNCCSLNEPFKGKVQLLRQNVAQIVVHRVDSFGKDVLNFRPWLVGLHISNSSLGTTTRVMEVERTAEEKTRNFHQCRSSRHPISRSVLIRVSLMKVMCSVIILLLLPTFTLESKLIFCLQQVSLFLLGKSPTFLVFFTFSFFFAFVSSPCTFTWEFKRLFCTTARQPTTLFTLSASLKEKREKILFRCPFYKAFGERKSSFLRVPPLLKQQEWAALIVINILE